MACSWKDLNKSVKDCMDIGSAVEQKVKLTTKASDGTKFEASQIRRTEASGKDRAGQFSNFCIKFGKAKGFNLDEFSVDTSSPESGKNGSKGTSKWSYSGLIPNCKLKAKISHDMTEFVPSKANVSADYSNGQIKATAGFTHGVLGDSAVQYNADLVFAASGDLSFGAAVSGSGASKPAEADLAFAFVMGGSKCLLQTGKTFSVLNAHVYNRCSPRFEVASSTALSNFSSAPSAKQTFGMCYDIDGNSTTNVKLALGDIMNFGMNNVAISAVYSHKVRSYARTNLCATVNLGETDTPKFGFNVEFGE